MPFSHALIKDKSSKRVIMMSGLANTMETERDYGR
jgi:hypothetical protein